MSIKKVIHKIFHNKHEVCEFESIHDDHYNPAKFWKTNHRISCSKCSHVERVGISIMKETYFGKYGSTIEEAIEEAKEWNGAYINL